LSADASTSTTASTALLEGLARGLDDAWRRICERYEPVLLRVARRHGLREEEARDVVQETMTAFLQAFRAHQYDRQRGRLRSWVQGIATNRIRESWRRVPRREVQIADGGSVTPFLNRIPDDRELADVFEQEWERGILAECLRRVRAEVEPKTLEAFELYVRQEWPAERVAGHLGITRETVYVHKSRVLARMRELKEELTETW